MLNAMDETAFLAALPIERRLALAYAPAHVRRLWLGLFALDARLGGVVRGAHEPMLAQIKLAWWRDQLARPPSARAVGEPLLGLLGAWDGEVAGLQALVDGWELVMGDQGPDQSTMLQYAKTRAQACAALAVRLNLTEAPPEAERAARGWALAEWAAAQSDPDQKALAIGLIAQLDWRRVSLPRELRPLQVLYGLAARQRGNGPLIPGPIAGLRAVRLGLLGI